MVCCLAVLSLCGLLNPKKGICCDSFFYNFIVAVLHFLTGLRPRRHFCI